MRAAASAGVRNSILCQCVMRLYILVKEAWCAWLVAFKAALADTWLAKWWGFRFRARFVLPTLLGSG